MRLLTTAQIAQLAHEVNRAYCQSIGDTSQPSWGEAPDWQKDSAIAGVETYIDNPDTTPEQSHTSWMAVKVEGGWVWGPEKDAEKKTHPCIMPYANLPKEQRVKDYLFGATVRTGLSLTAPTGDTALDV